MMGARVKRYGLIAVVAFALLVAACSSSESDVASSTTMIDASEELATEAISEMCRTLDLFSFAGTPPGNASEALAETDLVAATAVERTAYGRVLIEAPRAECPEHVQYADEIAYWLGF
jgi:hypothetical protein